MFCNRSGSFGLTDLLGMYSAFCSLVFWSAGPCKSSFSGQSYINTDIMSPVIRPILSVCSRLLIVNIINVYIQCISAHYVLIPQSSRNTFLRKQWLSWTPASQYRNKLIQIHMPETAQSNSIFYSSVCQQTPLHFDFVPRSEFAKLCCWYVPNKPTRLFRWTCKILILYPDFCLNTFPVFLPVSSTLASTLWQSHPGVVKVSYGGSQRCLTAGLRAAACPTLRSITPLKTGRSLRTLSQPTSSLKALTRPEDGKLHISV